MTKDSRVSGTVWDNRYWYFK